MSNTTNEVIRRMNEDLEYYETKKLILMKDDLNIQIMHIEDELDKRRIRK